MTLLFENFAVSQLNTALTISGLTMNIPPADSDRFPLLASVSNPAPITLYDMNRTQDPEIVYITNNPDDGSYTIIRAQEDTVAQAWPIGTIVSGAITAAAAAALQVDPDTYALKDLSNVPNSSVVTDLINNLAVTNAKLAALSVTTAKLALLSVDTAQLADISVTSDKIVNGHVTNVKMATDSISTSHIVNQAVTTEKISVFDRVPVGAILMHSNDSQPSGYLLCDGQAVSRTTYADLFVIISTNYGIGDGSTTFNLPDFDLKVPKGASGAPFTAPYGLGETHIAANKAHVHGMSFVEGAGAVDDALFESNGIAVAPQNTASEGQADDNLVGPAALFIRFIIKY